MKEEDQQLKNGLSADDTSKPLKKRRRRGRQWGSVQKLVCVQAQLFCEVGPKPALA